MEKENKHKWKSKEQRAERKTRIIIRSVEIRNVASSFFMTETAIEK